MRFYRFCLIFAGSLFLVMLTAAQLPLSALQAPTPPVTAVLSSQVLTVTKLEDTKDGRCDMQDCSLREAIAASPSGGVIIFKPGLTGVIRLEAYDSEDMPESKMLHIDKDLTIVGPGPKPDALIIDGLKMTKLLVIASSVVVNLSNLTFANGRSAQGTAGLRNEIGTLTVTNSLFQGNYGFSGGALENGGNMIIANTTFENNEAQYGGAIFNAGTMTVTQSTFWMNGAGDGGAIHNDHGIIVIDNSTFQNNTAGDTDNCGDTTGGGALMNFGTAIITYSTLQTNDTQCSSSIHGFANSMTTLGNSIITGKFNKANRIGAITDGGNNLQFPGYDCIATIPVGDPMLGSLQDNGGPTWTMALLVGSAAIGKMPPEKCRLVDQRGVVQFRTLRVENGFAVPPCDIGAFQTNTAVIATPTSTP